MAVIGQIRQKTGLLLGVIVAGMLIYLLGGMLSGSNSMFGNDAQDQVAIINGTEVKLRTYSGIKGETQVLYPNRNNMPDEMYQSSANRMAWDKVMLEFAYKPEFENLGLSISNDPEDPARGEMVDMIQGSTMDESVKMYFGIQDNDPSRVIDALGQIAEIDETNPETDPQMIEQKRIWDIFQRREVLDKRLVSKYENLLSKSVFVTTAEGKRVHQNQNATRAIEHVYIPFTKINDSTIDVTDAEVAAYAQAHKNEFASDQAEKVLKYIEFDIQPAGRDSIATKAEIEKIVGKLATQANAAAYARVQSDEKDVFKQSLFEELPFQIRMDSTGIDSAKVYGPFASAGGYVAYKIINVADTTAEASHILFSTQGLDDQQKAAKKLQAEVALERALNGDDFALMAQTLSEGPSKQDGGKLGDFAKADMVAPFSNAIWKHGKVGVVPEIVESQFGYHVINVNRAPSVKPKYYYVQVNKNHTAGQTTRDEVYSKANMALATIGDDASGFDNLDSTYNVKTIESVTIESASVRGIPDSKNIVNWAFRNEEGAVSEQAELVGKKYVVVGIVRDIEAGEVNIEKSRNAIKRKIAAEKKGEILAKLLQENLSDDLKATADKVNAIDGNAGYAQYQSISTQSMNSTYVLGASDEPALVGTAFGLADGKVSKVIVGERGVFVVKAGAKNEASEEPSSYDAFVSSAKASRSTESSDYKKVIKENTEIEDYRFRAGF